jgi:hypothetical protein
LSAKKTNAFITMKQPTLSKIKILTASLILFATVGFGQAVAKVSTGSGTNPTAGSDAGFERTIRKGNEGVLWNWGTLGHGSFDQTIDTFKTEGEFFNPAKDVATYTQGKFRYKVFTYAKVNYIEVDYGWAGGVYVYTTQ